MNTQHKHKFSTSQADIADRFGAHDDAEPLTDGKFLKRMGKLALGAAAFGALITAPALTLTLIILASMVLAGGFILLGIVGVLIAFADIASAVMHSEPTADAADLPCTERRSTSQHPADWTADYDQ